jgi:predicted phage baseplate assembly protein
MVHALGMQAVLTMLEQARTELCGERYKRAKDRQATRGGTAKSRLKLGGRTVAVRRPRVVDRDGNEIALEAWEQLSASDPMTDRAYEQMVVGPHQRFRLARAPVEPGSVRVEVREGARTTIWRETSDLFAAGRHDLVFQLFPATGELLFGGDGHGRALPPDDGTSRGGNVRVLEYRFGGGRDGNVGARTLTRVTSPSPEVRLDAVNVLEARGGADEEPLARGLARAPAVVRSRWRAVTAQDFEALALEAPGVARALALPNTRAGCHAGAVCGAVTVVLVPHAAFEETIRTPIELPPFIARRVRRHLDERRLLTTELHTSGAVFRPVKVRADVRVQPGASAAFTAQPSLKAPSWARSIAISTRSRAAPMASAGPSGARSSSPACSSASSRCPASRRSIASSSASTAPSPSRATTSRSGPASSSTPTRTTCG